MREPLICQQTIKKVYKHNIQSLNLQVNVQVNVNLNPFCLILYFRKKTAKYANWLGSIKKMFELYFTVLIL